MKKKWTRERNWEISKTEQRFEQRLEENGYQIAGIREYQSKTDYLIVKNGIEQEYSVLHVDQSVKRGDDCFAEFENWYGLTKRYLEFLAGKC